MQLGSHLSIAGGLENALIAAQSFGFTAVALFVRNQRQWAAKPLEDAQVETFLAARADAEIQVVVAHGSYLLNLASTKPESRRKSIDALADDLGRTSRLGIEYLVIHPGSNPDHAEGIAGIIAGIDEAIALADPSTMLLLETTAGQGNCIGHRFEDLAEIRAGVAEPDRLGVCLDTAHIFAAGYDIRTAETYAETMAEFDRVVGIKHLKAIHCNDSLKDFATRVDRHAHIGEGKIGVEAFRQLVNDKRLATIPMILETPKAQTADGEDYDAINKRVLEGLANL
ncbi:MAG: deoxyribonuclease IV [Phycisphaerales bacterium]|jgi:deoxyribonuclease IV|nr:deoxyribonuclease IV [Phycisphaerales bacterium]MBT7171148.1 deoxyribonuclease IV [Phycisphaerales bacterium]